jgi:hypothetical protein
VPCQKSEIAVKDFFEQVDSIPIPGSPSIVSEFLVGQKILQLKVDLLAFLHRDQQGSCEKP